MTGPIHISAAVLTHPARRHIAERLRDEHPELDPLVVVDPRPTGPRGAQRSARLAWAAVPPHATHHLVMEDDVVVSPEFTAELYRVVAARPRDALSLFSEWGSRSTQAARIAALAGSPWVDVMADYVPTQALVMPAEVARRFAAFLTATTDYEHTDAAVRRFLHAEGVEVVVSTVNLVDHLELRSLLSGHDVWGPRPSGCYLPNPADRADFADWTGPVLRPRLVPYLPRAQYLSRPLCLVKQRYDDDWRSLPATEYLATQGVPPHATMTDLLDALSAVPHGDALRGEIGYGMLHDLWQVVFVLGMAVAQLRPGIGEIQLKRAMSTSVARALLGSIAGGALRDRVDAETLERLDPTFDTLVRRGVFAGAHHVTRQAATIGAAA